MERIIYGDIRVQLLSESIVRVELKKKGAFCDENTFFIPDREQYAASTVGYAQEENVVCFGDYELYLPENGLSLAGMRVEKNGRRVYAYHKTKNSGELPVLDKTPEVFALADTPRILLPEGGYAKTRTGDYSVTENVQDVYLLFCRKDAKKLRALYAELTGRSELVRLSTLGGWNSKYYAYSEETAKQLILDYEAHNVPLDVMVVDTDWRDCKDGWGYDINKELFPDMARFLRFAHAHGVEVCFNDHPEPVNGAHVFKNKEIVYREKNLRSLLKKGLDIWWYDRNWSSHLVSPTKNVRHETFGLYLFHEITKHHWQEVAGDKVVYRRPVVMGNVVNVENGLYAGICDSASHRYSIQWTGDVASDFESLGQEVSNLLRGGNNGIAYINSDCGGHTGNPNKEEFIRWMQFGSLSPVFRPHCTNTVTRTREPWNYDGETLDVVRAYNNLRYRLLPVIYKNAYNNYETGEPIFKALGYEYPRDKKALAQSGEYLLGNELLIAPVVDGKRGEEGACKEVYLPAGKWLDVFSGKVYTGGRKIARCYALREMPLFVRMGALLPLAYEAKNTKEQKWDKLVYDFYPCKEASDDGYLYEDDTETTAYKQGMYRKSAFEAHYCHDSNAFVVTLHAGEGDFAGDKCFVSRAVMIKYHLLGEAKNVKRVCVNGEEVPFEKRKKDGEAFPLHTNGAAPDSDTLLATFEMDVAKDYEVKFYLA